MRTFRLYATRTFGSLATSLTAAFGTALFLAATSYLFVRALVRAEGTVAVLSSIWAESAVATLPCLAAIVTMRIVADDRLSGRMELILSAPISERDYLMGRFCGAFLYLSLMLLAYMAVPLVVLPCCATGGSSVALADFLPALVGLLFWGALSCAIGTLASACIPHAAAAGAATMVCVPLLPYAIYRAAFVCSPSVRGVFPVFPVERFASDAGAGMFSFAYVACMVLGTALALFTASKTIAARRFAGSGGGVLGLKVSTAVVVALGFVFAVMAAVCAWRLDFTMEWPLRSHSPGFSARTRSILADTHGETRATCFLSRRDPAWRGTARLLRGLEAAARDAAGTRLVVDFADPRWDLSTAVRLTRAGVREGTVVFERGRRRISVPIADVDESACASALLRLSLPAGRETVYWTVGHGEFSFDSYDPVTGMSTLARALRRDGYELRPFETAQATSVPDGCGVLVVAGARTPFSSAESAMVDSFLRRGGRLFVLIAPAAPDAGLARLLAGWGVRALPFVAVSPRTLDGADLVATDFGEHDVTRPLAGTAVVFQGAAPLAETTPSAGEKTTFTPLVRTDETAWGESDVTHHPWTRDASTEPAGPLVLAAALESGAGPRKDLALKPTRIVVVGDASFAVDGALSSRANANRDLFRNALAWLAGLDAATAPGTPADVLVTGMDRKARVRMLVFSAVVLPAVLFLFGFALAMRRRFV
ncbi:MAG: Gldg family protein [Kiritimatiellae bacterium]|nr:Gldg family protein [Kiritimatiellia bacterium]